MAGEAAARRLPTIGETTVTVYRERASYHLPSIALDFSADAEELYRVRDGEPGATRAETKATWRLSRGDWRIRTETSVQVGCSASAFLVEAQLAAFEGDREVRRRSWSRTIPRKLV